MRASLLLAGTLLVVLSGTATSQNPPLEPPGGAPAIIERVRSILRELVGEPPLEPEEAAARLARFGPEIVPHLLAVRDEFGEPVHVSVIADALSRLGSDRLEGYLTWVVGGGAPVPARVAAYVKLEQHGGRLALTQMIERMPRHDPREKRAAERAIATILGRLDSPQVYARVDGLLRGAPEDVRYRLLGCVADAGSRLGLPLLADRLGESEDLDLVVVSGIARLPVGSGDGKVLEQILERLDAVNPNLRRECALALGVFKVGRAVTTLIGLLGDADRGVRTNAHWSLRSISGVNLPPDPAAWKAWLERENQWWESEGQRFLELLDSADEEQVVGAIAMLAGRPLFRDRYAARLESLLGSGSERVREAAKRALAGQPVGSGGSAGPGGGRGVLAGGKIVRPPTEVVADLSEVESVESATGWWFYIVVGIFIVLFGLYVFGVIHPDRLRALLARSANR